MKIAGIVAEYNPFHNGHQYHIQKTREYGASHIVAVMSTSFTQRGEPAIIGTKERAISAISGGVDLVLALPVPYMLQSAQAYAFSAVGMLHALSCVDVLSFGCPCEDINALNQLSIHIERLHQTKEFWNQVKISTSYQKALQSALQQQGIDSELLKDGNNILGIEYLTALRKLQSTIKAEPVHRKYAMHQSDITKGSFASASRIRNLIAEKQSVETVENFLPTESLNQLAECIKSNQTAYLHNLERILLFQNRCVSPNQKSNQACNLETLIEIASKKTGSLASAQRHIIRQALQIEQFPNIPPYGRILAFNQRGLDILKKIKKNSNFTVDTSLANLIAHPNPQIAQVARYEETAERLYGLSKNHITSGEDIFTQKITCMKGF